MKSPVTVAMVVALALGACAARQSSSDNAPARQPAAPTAAPEPEAPRAATPQTDAKPATPAQPSNTWFARRLVRVSMDPNPDAAMSATLEAGGSEVIGEVLRNRRVAQHHQGVTATVTTRDEDEALDVEIVADLSGAAPGTPPVAKEIADDLVTALRQRLSLHAQGPMAEHSRQFEQDRARADEELKRTRAELAEVRTRVRGQTGRADVSVERLREELSQLEDSRQEVQLELESKDARLSALTDNIAKMSAKVEQSVQNDPVSAELAKVAEARVRQAERLKQMVEQGQSSHGEYEEALAAAAEARARLLERRSEAAHAAGADTLNDWNRELMSQSVDTAELQVRLTKLNERLSTFSKVVDDLDRMETLQSEREHAAEALRDAEERLRSMQHELASVRAPRSVVRESQDRTGPIPASRDEGKGR